MMLGISRPIQFRFNEIDLILKAVAHALKLRIPGRCILCRQIPFWNNELCQPVKQNLNNHRSRHISPGKKIRHLINIGDCKLTCRVSRQLRERSVAVCRGSKIIHMRIVSKIMPAMQIWRGDFRYATEI